MTADKNPVINTVTFGDYIKNLVRTHQHSGRCNNCERPFGSLVGWQGQEKLMSVHLHCPKCGSGHIVALKRRSVDVMIGELRIASKGCYCRKCGWEFHEMETFQHCEAAPPTKELKKLQRAEQVTQSVGMSVEDFKQKLNEFRQSKKE